MTQEEFVKALEARGYRVEVPDDLVTILIPKAMFETKKLWAIKNDVRDIGWKKSFSIRVVSNRFLAV